jgi:pimeloyl-ACP methyl ester carboxylesterase
LLFNETFVAEPAEGYYFDRWHRESLYLCGDLTNSCSIFTSFFEGHEVLMEILASDDVWFLAPVFEPAVCELPDEEIEVQTTPAGIEFVRTPAACFDSIDGYDYEPNYLAVAGLRYHYVDEGPRDGEVVLMLHGQPTWSYLYRKMIPVLVESGYRVIAVDHIGMGRSDKPVDPRVHEFEQHVAWMKALIVELNFSNITLFVQDWGSLIGLRIAGDMPELFARIVVANGDLRVFEPGTNPYSMPVFEFDESGPDALPFFLSRSREHETGFQQWIEFAATAPRLFAADVVDLASVEGLTPEQHASYNAPFPSRIYWGGIRAFPSMLAGIEQQNAPAWEALGRYDKPFLFLAGERDRNLGRVENQDKWIAHVPGAIGQDHRRYQAGHFIQEDVGAEMAARVVEFMQHNPRF